MIIDKLVYIGLNSKTISYYEALGYTVPRWKHPQTQKEFVKKGTHIWVSSLDLNPKSQTKVDVQCDYCGDIYSTKRVNIKNHGDCSCQKCSKYKQIKTMNEKYGVDNPMQVKEFSEKMQKSLYDNYGVTNPMKSSLLRKKATITCYDKYGVAFPMQSKEIQQKAKETCLSKYGYAYTFQVPSVCEKILKSIKDKYGVSYISQSPEIRKRVTETVRKRYGVDSVLQLESVRKKINPNFSKQQMYIADLYKGILNYPFSTYHFDVLINDNIDLEIDFGGHTLQVKKGCMSLDEFKQKEIIRNNIIKRGGYKIVRYVSSTDKMPDNGHLFQMLDDTIRYFEIYPNHSWLTFDIDESKVYSAEFHEGKYYDFGKTYKLKCYPDEKDGVAS